MPDDKMKKYPWTKSVSGDKKEAPAAECVYAGPRAMRRRAPIIGRIYAGPRRDTVKPVYAAPEPVRPAKKAEAVIEGVYAGPGYAAGPQKPDNPPAAATMFVYAGPPVSPSGAKAPFPPSAMGAGIKDPEAPRTDAGTCGTCGAALPEGARYCTACGAKVKKTLFCPECGVVLDGISKFCSNCGARLAFPPVCGTCGKTLSGEEKYCPICGTETGRS